MFDERAFYPGYWYVDALVGGERCLLKPADHILTHVGRVPLPSSVGLGLIQLRCWASPTEFRFAGASWERTTEIYEWSTVTRAYRRQFTPVISVNPVIYLPDGTLKVNHGEAGAMGYRYIDARGEPVSSDDSVLLGELSQPMYLGDGLYIGQGHPDWAREACWVLDTLTNSYREVERGRCTFIRSDTSADGRVALAIVKPDPHPDLPSESDAGAVIIRTTLAQLRALPLVVWPHPKPPDEVPVFQKCEVTVDRFTLTPAARIPDGVVAEFHDRENAHGAHVRLWVEGGSMRMSIDYPGAGPGLKGVTGLRRPVR